MLFMRKITYLYVAAVPSSPPRSPVHGPTSSAENEDEDEEATSTPTTNSSISCKPPLPLSQLCHHFHQFRVRNASWSG